MVERTGTWTLEELTTVRPSGHIANLVLHTHTIPCHVGSAVLPTCWVSMVILHRLSEACRLQAVVQHHQGRHHAILTYSCASLRPFVRKVPSVTALPYSFSFEEDSLVLVKYFYNPVSTYGFHWRKTRRNLKDLSPTPCLVQKTLQQIHHQITIEHFFPMSSWREWFDLLVIPEWKTVMRDSRV